VHPIQLLQIGCRTGMGRGDMLSHDAFVSLAADGRYQNDGWIAPEGARSRMTNHRRPDDPNLHFEVPMFLCCNRRPDGDKRGSCAARGSEMFHRISG